MGLTKVDELRTAQARIYLGTSLPTAPSTFYDNASNDVDSTEWKGGEMCYLTNINKLFIQQATSGTTAEWYRYQDEFSSA